MSELPDEIGAESGRELSPFASVSRRASTVQSITMQFSNLGIAILQGFLLTPLCLKHINYKLYGAWLATGQILGWISLLDPGVNEVLRQRVARSFGAGQRNALGVVLGSGLVVSFLIALIPTVAGLCVGFFVNHFVALDYPEGAELRKCFIMAVFGTGLTIASFAPGAALQGLQRQMLQGAVSLAGSASYLVSAIAFLYAGWGLQAIPMALLIRGGIWVFGWTLALVWIAKRELAVSFKVHLNEGKQTLGISAVNGVSNLGVTVQNGTDAFIAGTMLGPESAATLSLTGALGSFIRLVPDRIVYSFLPGMAHLAGEGDEEKFRTISWRLVQIVIALLALAMGTVVIVNEIFMKHWVGSKPYGGLMLTVALSLSTVLFSSCSLMGSILFSRGVIKGPAYVRLGQSVLQMLLVFLLIHRIRLVAIPAALAISAAVGLTAYFIQQYSSTVHGSNSHARCQWKWFWLPSLGSIALATVIAVAARPQTILGAAVSTIVYWTIDGIFLLAINKALRDEALQLYSFISTSTRAVPAQ
jgi:O-antigen/teichoic acid export membrane protein